MGYGKNIFAHAFGAFLKKMRDRRVEEVHRELGISSSYYRLVESGGTVISPSKSRSLVETFEKLEWVPLVKYLVAAQSLDSDPTSWSILKERADYVVSIDGQLKKFLDSLKEVKIRDEEGNQIRLWDLKPEENPNHIGYISNILESDECFHILSDYLTIERSSSNTISNIDQVIVNKIEKSSSLLVDSVFENIKNMQSYRLHFATGDSKEFERKNRHKFRSLKALLINYEKIISYDNLKDFNYKWLWLNRFNSAEFVCLRLNNNGSEIDTNKLKDKFESNLKRVYKEFSFDQELEPENWKEAIGKVKFIDGNLERDKIDNILTLENYSYNITNLWIYDYINGNKVGFAYGENEDINGLNLTYGESFDKWEEISNIIKPQNDRV